MAAINFPSSPSNGDTHVVDGVTYTYNSAETKWKTTINSNAFLPLSGGTVSGNIAMGGEIQHDGDTDTNISFGTDTILFDTAGSERFRVGSAGQLGIGGATYGTDGQVLTSTGATTAPAWEDLPSSLSWTSSVVSATGSGVELTGIPATAQQIIIAYSEVSTDSNTGQAVQLGDAGGYETTGYYYNFGALGVSPTGYYRSNSTIFFHNDSFALSSNVYWGTIILTKAGGNFWNILWRFNEQTSNYSGFCFGGKATSAALTQVKFRPIGGNWDNGQVNFKYLA